jgi:hypothetical protein
MIHSLCGPLPKHRYVWIQPQAMGNHGWLRAVWFGLVSHPSRAWGCNVMLECGAIYRNVPLHQLALRIRLHGLRICIPRRDGMHGAAKGRI